MTERLTLRRPIPILFTIPNFITAGSGQALLNVVQRLDRDRFAPSICVLRRGGRLESVIEAEGIPLLELPFTVPARPLRSLPAALWRAARHFRPYHFALWHSYHYADDYTEPLIARLSGAKAWVYTKKNMNWGDRAWHVRSFLATRIVAQNADMIERFFGTPSLRAKTRLIPRGVDTDKFQSGGARRLDLRSRLRLSPETILIGCVANLLPIKGQPLLIRAFALLANPSAVLVLAGKASDPVYTAELRQLCTTLGIEQRVYFLNEVQDIPAFDADLDLFVFPSGAKGEGCPVALLEALSCGLPCVATDVPGSRDLIEPERSGLLIAEGDDAALAAVLRRLIDSPDLRQTLGQGARARVMAKYTLAHEGAAHEALYAEILNR